MAELGTVCDLKELEKQLQSLCSRYTCNELQVDSKPFCSSFCKLVEYYASRWKVPLPQLRILERAFCCFTQASAFFTVGCDHVLRTLSSLALSTFELLLFFDQKDFTQDPLRKITVTFQECCSSLARFQNVHLLQVERLLQAGGPWVSQTLHAILSESILPQTEVEGCISSEPPVFFELRVRYLLSCQRLPEAQALAKCCAQHPTVGQHLFFFQVYLTGLYKMAQHERLLEEVMDFNGKDAVNFICSLESEENDDLLLDLSRVFLSLQLRRGDMHFLCDLVCLWGRLHSRLKTSKETLLKDCEQLILSATNVNAIFPFIRAITQELSEDGVQFCMELCANALRSCPPCDVITKSLIYKTMASLVPNDLEICRACALLVFFLERSVEAYKMVYILYMLPDQEYHVDCCPIGNRIRFETLQILKKDLYFDPEFWNLIALRTNCLKLINEKVLSAALEEIMEEKWVPTYCLKETKSTKSKSKLTRKNGLNKVKILKGDRQNHSDNADKAPAKKVGRPRLNKNLPLKKGNQGSRQWKNMPAEPTRRSTFWQMDRVHCNRASDSYENRRTTRLSERVPAKRMIRTPKWLLEDSGTLEKPVVKKQYPSFPYLPLRRRRVAVKKDSKDNVNADEMLKENQVNDMKQEKEVPQDSQTASTAPQVVLELSLPDNELLGTFTDESCNRHRGLPQRLYYKPTLKVLSENEPKKANIHSEVIISARDTTSFIRMLHCYSKRPKGRKTGTNSVGPSASVTHSSDQVDTSNKEQINDKPAVEMKVTISSQTHEVTDTILRSPREKLNEKGAETRNMDTVFESKVTQAASIATAIAESAVEMEVNIATQKNNHSEPPVPRLEDTENTEHISSAVSKQATLQNDSDHKDEKLPVISESKPQETVVTNGEVLVNGTQSQEDDLTPIESSQAPFDKPSVEEPIAETESNNAHITMDNLDNLASVPAETEIKPEMHQNLNIQKDRAAVKSEPVLPKIEKNDSKPLLVSSPSNSALEDDGFDPMEPQPECEESHLEFCCFFCHKDVKGRHLVAHAMFHYRKDECMFCGVAFKNNLKAMMHMSNHLEKLKKLQNPTAHCSPKQSRAKLKAKRTVKAKTVSNERRKRGREKEPPPTVRKLRSGSKFGDETKQEEGSVRDMSKDQVHKVNGHIGKRKKRTDTVKIENSLITKTRLRHRSTENHRNNEISFVKTEKEKALVLSSEEKHEEKATFKTDDKSIGHCEKLCCPVDGCTWFTVKKAAFLYHVLENHSLDIKPLEFAFRVANNSCSVCKRVLYSFEHFQHHVGRHKSAPRHPCPHKGCTARFKTTIEMRRHARKHNPLQAVCCLPGCPKLFICQWALILHEKDHYSKRSKVTQSNDKPKNTEAAAKLEEIVTKKCMKSKEKTTPSSSSKFHKDTDKKLVTPIPKKDINAQSAATKLLQKLRKRQMMKNNLSQQATRKKISAVGKQNLKLSHSLQRRENKAKQLQCSKILTPQEDKSVKKSNCVKNITSEKDSNQEKVQKKFEDSRKNMCGSKTSSTGKVRNQRVKSTSNTIKIERNVSARSKDDSKTSISKRTKYVQRKLKTAAPVDGSPVLNNANIDTTGVTDSATIVKDRNGTPEEMVLLRNSSNAEEVACQKEISNPTAIDSKVAVENVKEETVQIKETTADGAVVDIANIARTENENLKMEIDAVFKAEGCEQEPVTRPEISGQENSIMEPTESIEDVNLDIITRADVANQVTSENGTVDSHMVLSSNAPCNAIMEQNVASSQTAESENVTIDHVFVSSDVTVIQNVEYNADFFVNSVEMAERPTSVADINGDSFENASQVTNKEHDSAEDVSILEKLENSVLAADADISQTEEVESKELETITTEQSVSGLVNNANSSSETSSPTGAQKRFRPTFCNKNDILSALKTFVKSKNDNVKTKNKVKNSATKRKIELIKTSTSKKLKSETQVQEDMVVPVGSSSSSEEKKTTETTDSSATNTCSPVSMSSDVSLTSKAKEGKVTKVQKKSQLANKKDAVKKQKTLQSKAKKKPRIETKDAVDKKKRKQEKAEAKSAKRKTKYCKIKAKTSTKIDTLPPELSIANFNEVTCQSVPAGDTSQEGNEHNYNREDDMHKNIQVDVKEPLGKTCLKQRNVYDLVPEEEDNPLAAFEKALTEYKKRPYMRLPATAYLEEKFTVMPKRRKDMSMFFGSSKKIQTSPQQRQRCANCFTTFSSEEELQWHLQQKCSSLFGFDSDEEGTS